MDGNFEKLCNFLIKEFRTANSFTNKEVFHLKDVQSCLNRMITLGLIEVSNEQHDVVKYTWTRFGHKVLKYRSWTRYKWFNIVIPRWLNRIQPWLTIVAVTLSFMAYCTSKEDTRLHNEEINIQKKAAEKENQNGQDIQELRKQIQVLQGLNRDSL
ncbi:MAG: hypothetical protein ACK514_09850 [Bacteroidota bacterium]|jgi:hypothetical protein|nr:hypothetical protein [Cytophagales bacterium]MCA6431515.1 hypothetical protein [Cytophagales bacterium]MCE2956189.1 hypothetical protein [Flammeovirgaceae bacterium]MCZ8071412.1 hypothetical protein [Cytophagales bacterium]